MKKIVILLIVGILAGHACHAACPDGFEEIPMEHITMTESGGHCTGDTDAYYTVDDMCNANVLE